MAKPNKCIVLKDLSGDFSGVRSPHPPLTPESDPCWVSEDSCRVTTRPPPWRDQCFISGDLLCNRQSTVLTSQKHVCTNLIPVSYFCWRVSCFIRQETLRWEFSLKIKKKKSVSTYSLNIFFTQTLIITSWKHSWRSYYAVMRCQAKEYIHFNLQAHKQVSYLEGKNS